MAIGDVDGAVAGDDHVARLIEGCSAGGTNPRGTQSHQEFTVRAELHDHMPLAFAPRVLPVGTRRVGHPDMTRRVDVQPVWLDQHAAAEAGDDPSGGVELEDGIEVKAGTAVVAASLRDPNVLAVPVHVDATSRPPFAAIR